MTSDLACPAGRAWKSVAVPKPYPQEFRDDVVRVAQAREDGVTLEQIAADFWQIGLVGTAGPASWYRHSGDPEPARV